ncbi:MAG: copper resistance protein CopC, partial [Anaerolineales bacterium]|nr:copper resistance protein CopC [Anaerolineales bacterium]
MNKFIFRAGVIFVLTLLTVATVSAHAKLVRANPAPNSIVAVAPSQIQLWFDEPLELNFSAVQVLDANKQRVDTGELVAVAGDPNSLIAPLKPTGDGTYNVIWKVLSAADGHITNGVFAYGVGAATRVTAPANAAQVAAPNELTPFAVVIRWLSLLSLLGLVGGFIFRFFILERSLDNIHADKSVRDIAYKRWQQLAALALAL